MKKRNCRVGIPVFVAALLLLPFHDPQAQEEKAKTSAEPTAMEIVKEANRIAYYQGSDGRARVFMTIKDDQGRERTREFTILRYDVPPPNAQGKSEDPDAYCGDQKFYVYFHQPADVNKMVFMVWKHTSERMDDRWLYLPSLDLVKRIASTEKRTSFVGSHFFYEDVSGRNLDADRHELVDVTDNYFVIESTPKDPDEVEFHSFKTWIHKKTFSVVKTEYYSKKEDGEAGPAYRVYEAKKFDKIQGKYTTTKSLMKDLRTGGETVLEYRDVKYDLGLPDTIFTERFLRRPPVKYLK